MAYLLLFAMVLVAGIAVHQSSQVIQQRSIAQLFFTIGFALLGVGLLAQLVLGFTLDENAARVFYWARGAMALAWFGQGLLIYLFPKRQITRWLTFAVIVATVVMFGMVFFTQVSEAQEWYSTSRPIFGQIGDLLATNRPTRWGALALNLYGFALLMAGSIYHLVKKANARSTSWVSAVLITACSIGLFVPLYFPPVENNLVFYLVELLTPIALFIGLDHISIRDIKPTRKSP